MANANLTAERLRELLYYDQDTGIFTRRISTRPNAMAGMIAGGLDAHGYVNICVDKRRYKAHRLAWLYVFGAWPKHEIDHINGVKNDNRIFNLRDVERLENGRNHVRPTKRNKTSGVLGVTAHKNKWKSGVTVGKKRFHVGVFDTKEEAHQAYVLAKRKLHAGGCTL